MYGLEKSPQDKFEFDLEDELKNNPEKAKETLDKINVRTQEIKNILREGSEKKESDELGILLHGYTALQKVLTKVKES